MEQYQAKVTEQARTHLILIKEYIANELQQPNSAKRMLDLLKEAMMSLSLMPHRIKRIEEKPWRDLGFRKIRVKNYYIYFWINEDEKQVQIIAVIYVKMDQKNLKAWDFDSINISEV